MDENDVMGDLKKTGALKKGHFRLTSGRHSDTYVQCALLLRSPEVAVRVGEALARKIEPDVDLVLSPAVGALIAGFAVALELGCEMMFAERVEGKMKLRRDFEIPPGAEVLIVEDVITTGGSVLELASLVEEAGAGVAGIACIVNRLPSGAQADAAGKLDGYPLHELVRVDAHSYEEGECPLCREGTGIDAPGSRFID